MQQCSKLNLFGAQQLGLKSAHLEWVSISQSMFIWDVSQIMEEVQPGACSSKVLEKVLEVLEMIIGSFGLSPAERSLCLNG